MALMVGSGALVVIANSFVQGAHPFLMLLLAIGAVLYFGGRSMNPGKHKAAVFGAAGGLAGAGVIVALVAGMIYVLINLPWLILGLFGG